MFVDAPFLHDRLRASKGESNVPDYIIKVRAPDDVFSVLDLQKLEDVVYDYLTSTLDDACSANIDV